MQVFDVFLLEAILNGLLFGGVLALLALGLNLVFGVIDVVWICYAELMMIGMYTVYFLYTVYKLPLLVAFAGGILVVAVLGMILHVLVIRPVLNSEPINQLLVTGGVLFFLQAAATPPSACSSATSACPCRRCSSARSTCPTRAYSRRSPPWWR